YRGKRLRKGRDSQAGFSLGGEIQGDGSRSRGQHSEPVRAAPRREGGPLRPVGIASAGRSPIGRKDARGLSDRGELGEARGLGGHDGGCGTCWGHALVANVL
ncbi:MAG: hypothetical protein MJD61_00535, partial [Proteobacteria bacterium]|nr:hypothetical protein [Pseudomonadota bacterium]